ncbi:Uncharacterized protein YR821_2474 [Yersinia ruckeri]|uniref:Uncharacterized protein n=1 Tax=Yersinia ruckeri TaxID=29486 RepID=A0A0A8VFG8_YERRU|nr:hypothetical protein yruck0001_9530 [Yersinia ruckeri ATCC 29473]QTD77392.1 Uncharacterized protein YR821_2474 [Yersinia ruckeri]CEK28305.1 hypothetical protein CSF007_12835 [Yersinia ruckeri]
MIANINDSRFDNRVLLSVNLCLYSLTSLLFMQDFSTN